MSFLNTGLCIIFEINLITVIVVPPKLHSKYANRGRGFKKNVIVFDPLLTAHVIRRMRSGRVRIFNGIQRETL